MCPSCPTLSMRRSAAANDAKSSGRVSSSNATSLSGIPAARTAVAIRIGYTPCPAISATGRRASNVAGRNAEGRATLGDCAIFNATGERSFDDDVQDFARNEDHALDRFPFEMRSNFRVFARELERGVLRQADWHELIAAVLAVHLKHEFHLGNDEPRG